MADTQWTYDYTTAGNPDGDNPNAVAVSIINELNKEFIKQGVKFVIQVGDLTDNGRDEGIQTRAAAAQALYEAGIGFFPMRGNHETYSGNPNASSYGGLYNSYAIPAFQENFPQTRGLSKTFGATNFPKQSQWSSRSLRHELFLRL